MTAFLDFLLEPFTAQFMQRAFLSGAFLGALMASLGVIATVKKMAFFSEGVAHASLAGIALAILVGFTPLPLALLWGVVVAVIIYRLERTTLLPSDTLIGILFTSSMALGVVLMHFTQGYQPELLSFLFGSILGISAVDLPLIVGLSSVILIWFFASRKSLTFLALNADAAAVSGVRVARQQLLFYLALAIATVLTVKLLGIVLVSALLIIPPATARLLSNSFAQFSLFSLILAEIAVFFGLFFSYYSDLPSGAVIVLLSALLFFFAVCLRVLRR